MKDREPLRGFQAEQLWRRRFDAPFQDRAESVSQALPQPDDRCRDEREVSKAFA